MPPRERSDTRTVTRGPCEHILDFHKTLRAPGKIDIEKVNNDVLPRSQPLFVEVYKELRLLRKMSPRHPKSCACHAEPSSCPKSNSMAASQRGFFRPFLNVVQVNTPNTAPATQNGLQKHFSCRTTLAHVFSDVQKAPRLPRG